METSGQTRDRLKGILDRIGPGLDLRADDRVLVAAFGDEDTTPKATHFAHDNHCVFRYEPGKYPGDGVGFFGRAYPKEDDRTYSWP